MPPILPTLRANGARPSNGALQGRAECDQQAAERFARALLMPADTFDAQLRRPAVELAECFIAPLDHVSARRQDRKRGRTQDL